MGKKLYWNYNDHYLEISSALIELMERSDSGSVEESRLERYCILTLEMKLS
jgi:hypothetical protein